MSSKRCHSESPTNSNYRMEWKRDLKERGISDDKLVKLNRNELRMRSFMFSVHQTVIYKLRLFVSSGKQSKRSHPSLSRDDQRNTSETENRDDLEVIDQVF